MVRNGKNRDLHLQEIKYYYQTGKHDPDTTSVEKNRIVKATKRFMLSDNDKYIYYDIGFYLVICYIHIIYIHFWH